MAQLVTRGTSKCSWVPKSTKKENRPPEPSLVVKASGALGSLGRAKTTWVPLVATSFAPRQPVGGGKYGSDDPGPSVTLAKGSHTWSTTRTLIPES